ncbi:glycosyltransferase family 71 protein [Gonapodya prolifera JEL478]|uniref:Glycosyltransferase family 71 protein n=1 Tax=Gonapodya prolifera (strain JEL478) TaxID=1344416 RepID=A0A139AFB4_GONPJ|nr:glycosyltransferase family 71 protein [Gonapodya prolifera JEL478]|eukprot:KXS15448.1 glycosyltransferase family 71 protein [Gonapodya prolifera JEL478]
MANRTVLSLLVIANLVAWMLYARLGGRDPGSLAGQSGGSVRTISIGSGSPNDSTRDETILNIQVVKKKGTEGVDGVHLVVDGVRRSSTADQERPEGDTVPKVNAAPSPTLNTSQPITEGSGRRRRPARPPNPDVLPSGLTLADFYLSSADQESLLSTIPIEDFSTLGERIRTWVQLDTRLSALDEWRYDRFTAEKTLERSRWDDAADSPESPQTYNHPSTPTLTTLDRFRRFVHLLEYSLFPFVRPTFPSASNLYSSFARAPRSRGIVMTAGNGQVRMALVGIMSIRAAGCQLPIEVLYAGDDDLKPESRARFQSMGDGYSVTVRDAKQLFDDEIAKVRGWAIKPFAIMFASFAEVVFQDSDVVWFGSPEEVFEDPVYKKTGTLFYFDRRTLFGIGEETFQFSLSLLPAHLRDPVPSYLTAQNAFLGRKSAHQQESGVVAVDKTRAHNFYGLLTTCKMNCEEERDKVVYKRVYGDKETFWMGWEMAGQTGLYGWSPHSAAQIGYVVRGDQNAEEVVRHNNFAIEEKNADRRSDTRICSLQLAHLDASGTKPLWFNGGPLRDKFLGQTSPVTRPTHWAVERGSKWDLYGDNIACLYLREDAAIEVRDDGIVVDKPSKEEDGKEDKPFKSKDEGGVGGSVPHRLSPREMKVFDRLKEWWEEAGREGLREMEAEGEGQSEGEKEDQGENEQNTESEE